MERLKVAKYLMGITIFANSVSMTLFAIDLIKRVVQIMNI